MILEGIQSLDLCKIRSSAGDKKTGSGVDEENKLNSIYGNKYRINLDPPILTDHGVLLPAGPLPQPGFRTDPSPSQPSGKRLGCVKARVQVGKHPAGVRDNKK